MNNTVLFTQSKYINKISFTSFQRTCMRLKKYFCLIQTHIVFVSLSTDLSKCL